jgi:hypothetical protein
MSFMSPNARNTGRIALVGLVAAALLAVMASPSSALVVSRGSKQFGIQPTTQFKRAHHIFSELKPRLEYNGGPVMPETTVYVIFWDPAGVAPYAPGYTSGVVQYFTDLAHDSGLHTNVQSVSAQYTDSEGHHAAYKVAFGGEILDTDKLPRNRCSAAVICLSGAQLEKEVKKVVKKQKLPSDLKHIYFLMGGPGMANCFTAGSSECSANSESPAYCAYHTYINTKTGPIVWANDPYEYGGICDEAGRHPRNSPGDAALLGGLSHEYNEALTDPELNAWTSLQEGENGDECRTFVEANEFGPVLGFAPDGSPYNQLINGHLYDYQQEWSNIGNECKQRL